MMKRLMIVDDEAGITRIVGLVATQLGLDFKALNSSVTARDVFVAYRPDVLIIDVSMPEKDGIAVLEEVLATGIPARIVLTSGFGDACSRRANEVTQRRSVEPARFLRKPFRRTELEALLGELASGS